MTRLYICFGLTGILSALAWLVAGALCLIYLRHPRRERRFAVAFVLALAGVGLAIVNAARVGEIRLDRSDEIRAAQEAQQRLVAQEEQARREAGEAVVRFAEDAPGEAVGAPLVATDDVARTAAPLPAGEPSYRAGGKQQRTSGKVDEAAARLARAALGGGSRAAKEPVEQGLKLPDYRLANTLSRVNTLLSRLVFLAVLGILVGDYLRRFNHPFECYLPLPIPAAWVAHVSPEWFVSMNATPDQRARFLETVVRKGQTFIYVGDRVPAADINLNRIRLKRWGWWPKPLVVLGGAGIPDDPDFVFDALWFNRYAVIVPSASADRFLSGMVDRLAGRVGTRAAAARVPHLVWDAPFPDAATRQRLTDLCAEARVRLVVVT